MTDGSRSDGSGRNVMSFAATQALFKGLGVSCGGMAVLVTP